ncbi:MAG: hypothetical protein V3V21_04835 [Thermoplasmata archaeon]
MGKYSSFGHHLSDLKDDKQTLSFREVEQILGFPLPASAFRYRPWWANDPTHVQAMDGWISAGWEVESVDFENENVIFGRCKKMEASRREVGERPSQGQVMNSRSFEQFSGEVMSQYFNMDLRPGQLSGCPKLFDFVSSDRKIAGDAKYLTMVRGKSLPPAKFSVIAEHVWLLEKTEVDRRFLVFGNDRRVPEEWLKRYGGLVDNVEFYFLDESGSLEKLN